MEYKSGKRECIVRVRKVGERVECVGGGGSGERRVREAVME